MYSFTAVWSDVCGFKQIFSFLKSVGLITPSSQGLVGCLVWCVRLVGWSVGLFGLIGWVVGLVWRAYLVGCLGGWLVGGWFKQIAYIHPYKHTRKQQFSQTTTNTRGTLSLTQCGYLLGLSVIVVLSNSNSTLGATARFGLANNECVAKSRG